MMKKTHKNGLEIAVVGMAVRLPCASTPAEFYERLCRSEELIRPIEDAELLRNGVTEQEIANPAYVKAAGYLDGRFEYDADFFDYKPREAEFMDPQLRLLHECCWEALESGGCDPQLVGGATGLYLGTSQNMHWLRAVSHHIGDSIGEIYDLKMLYQREFFSTRIAYRLNLKGPAIGIDTTCSTSLVAIHLAAQALLSGDCDVALAGGACVSPILKGYPYHEGMIQSPDGRCRPFDAEAKGTVPGQGVAIVALKRLDDAIADGNPIHAVLKSSAINNDGDDKVGYTAPSVSGQSRVIQVALELAGVDSTEIDFVECHGTATRIGDPIEVQALTMAYGEARREQPCLIGSVKSNIGHLDTAAGAAGFIKAVMAVKHAKLPPSLHYSRPNPLIGFGDGLFAVNAASTELTREDRPVRGGVSSFGIGGTNAHVIVEEYVERREAPREREGHWLFPLSAKTGDAVLRHADGLFRAMASDAVDPAALAATLQRARRHYPIRDFIVADSRESLRRQLREIGAGIGSHCLPGGDVVFLFSGQGAQYPGMTRDLYANVPVYRARIEACFDHFPAQESAELRTLLLSGHDPELDARIARTDLAQPLLFIVEYALAWTLMNYGVRPSAMIGHSIGEYVAACLAGVFSLGDALALVRERGRLMAAAAPGAMLGVKLSEAEIAAHIGSALDLAAVNSSDLTVVAGAEDAIADLERRLAEAGVACTRLKTSHAYHSGMMEPILPAFRARVSSVVAKAPTLPYYSNVTGARIEPGQMVDTDYWCRHLRGTVRFADALASLLSEPNRTFVEVGPGNALVTFVRQHAAFRDSHTCLQTVRHPRQGDHDHAVLLRAVGQLYASGSDLAWRAIDDAEIGSFVEIPTYPFAKTKYEKIGTFAPQSPQVSDTTKGGGVRVPAKIVHARSKLSTPFIEAITDVQRSLCALWADTFKIDQVGIEDDFFELGGHSLLATRMLGDVRDTFGADISLNGLFERPNVNGLAMLVESASTVKGRVPELVAIDRGKPIPASFQQRRLWMIDRLGGGSAQYNMPSPFILKGDLDHDALQAALQQLVRRHESLRTVFREVDGEPVQVIIESATVDIRKVDLSALDAEERDRRQKALIREDALRPFDLANELPLRITMAVLGDRRHLLLFNAHHIVSDGWSEVLLVKEFAEIYQALSAGREPVLPTLSRQYADFAAWQRNWLVGETLETELAFWRGHLVGIPPVHSLPLDRPRPPSPTHAGAVIRRRIDAALLQRFRELARSNGATLFMALQAAFSLLLSRWSNSDDIVMGTPIAGRQHKALEPLIGFFVNTLLLRTDLGGDSDFVGLLARTKQMALSAFEHQHVPFEMLIDELAPTRSRNHAPLFQILFALQNYERGSFSLEGLELERVEETVSAKFDLTLITAESEEGLFADWYYDTDLFDREKIERMSEQYEVLLSSIVAAPEKPVRSLPIMSDGDLKRLLGDWQHHVPPPADLESIVARFEACVLASPDAHAVRFGEDAISYHELNARANRIAHRLIATGAKLGDLVAICLPVGMDMVASIIAALKAGTGYVPMDPTYPSDRLTYVLADSAPVAMIVDGAAPWSHQVECSMLNLSSPAERAVLQSQSDANLVGREAGRDMPAYVIYTSGSTGAPKGVVITLAQLGASHYSRDCCYGKPKSALLLNSIAFDSSVPTLYSTLLNGGCLCLCDDDQRRDPVAIAELVDRHEIAQLLALPSVYSAVLDCLDGEKLTGRSLDTIILAAEVFSVEVKAKHFAHRTVSARLYNEYGPTECSVWSTVYLCESEREEAAIPIGRSPGHAKLYVLDSVGGLTPIGVEGELFIGGDGVGMGYLRKPQLTAERFLADPYRTDGEPARMYRSGDRVRWSRDGQLEFLGRIDNQVKLRGYRIELGEIDVAMESHPDVSRAVAQVRGDRLVLYVECVPGAASALTVGEAREFLSSRLPDYMLPQRVVALDRIPLLPNGKVDQNALPVPVDETSAGIGLQPRNDLERLIQEVWCEVLRVESPAIDQDFFSLGGDSILLLRLTSLLNRGSYRFVAKTFYQEPTIEHLARLIVKSDRAASKDEVVAGEQALHPMQLWFLGRGDADPHHFNQSVLLRARDGVDQQALHATVQALYQRHDTLRLRFHTNAHGAWRAEYRPLSEDIVDRSVCEILIEADDSAPGTAIERAADDFQRTLSLGGPLMRVAILRHPDAGVRLLIVAHHLIVDGVSWRVLLQDFESAYRQAASGSPIVLAPKPTSLQRAVAAIHEMVALAEVRAEAVYWQQVLASPLHEMRASTDDDFFADEAHENLVVAEALTTEILTGCHRAYGMSMDEVLLAAVRSAFRTWRGIRNAGIWMEGHGRTMLQDALYIGETVGWFTAAYPVAFADCGDDPAEILRDTKDTLRAMPAKGVHYGLLRHLGEEKDRLDDDNFRRNAVLFNYLGQFDQTLQSDAAFVPVAEKQGRNISERRRRDAAIAFDGMVSSGCLRFSLKYNRLEFSQQDIRSLADAFVESLAGFVRCWNERDLRRPTLGDLRLLTVERDEFERWSGQWSRLEDAYPATGSQQGMLVQSMREGGTSGAYVNQLMFSLGGAVDEPRLLRAWASLPYVHSVFRTAFAPVRSGGLAQLLLAPESVRIPVAIEDLREQHDADQEATIAAATEKDLGIGFDPETAPLTRVRIWRVADDRYRLLWSTHHAIIDGWSLPLVLRTLLDAYMSGDSKVASPPCDFKRYIQWLNEQDASEAEAYWRRELAVLDAPCLIAGSAPAAVDSQPAALTRAMERVSVAVLESLAKSIGVTFYSLVQCAWAYLLHAYTGRDRVCFGSVVSGRPPELSGVETVVGLFINTLPVVVEIEHELTLRDWARKFHQANLDRQGNGFLSLQRIQQFSPLGARGALFNTAVVYENYPVDSIREAGGGSLPLRIDDLRSRESTGSGLTLVVMPGEGLSLKLMYQSGEFGEPHVRRLLDHFVAMLEAMSGSADRPLSVLDDVVATRNDVSADANAPDEPLSDMSDEELLSLLEEIETETRNH